MQVAIALAKPSARNPERPSAGRDHVVSSMSMLVTKLIHAAGTYLPTPGLAVVRRTRVKYELFVKLDLALSEDVAHCIDI